MESEQARRERRKHKRLDVTLKIYYHIKGPVTVIMKVENKEIEASMLDLSQGGIALLTNYNIPTGTVLDMRFSLVDVDTHIRFSLHGSIKVTGEVKYNKPMPKSQYRLGIEFIHIDPKDESTIINFIDTLLSSGPIV